ncbi:(2Fe-2S)-binding protein [Histidinibacterium aquaticum]|uniref:Ferric siderophore reductase C-terminal domain-containing protein n=1 Tax=Histidinibacterium aquaticum TaxID=2613962 RepID=A0A5J5GJ43_9RHOB|nr:hypothetical protein [Histidinibacterium aquaticum]KAA9008137.1 hypothetical protein F3S47_11600 [Histidinibacterium aquaticum]
MRPPSLVTACADRPDVRSAFGARLSDGPAPADALHLSKPDAAPLRDWLAAEQAEVSGADRKLAAAFLLGRLSWSLVECAGFLALRGYASGSLPTTGVAVSRREERWSFGERSGRASAYDLHLSGGAAIPSPDPAADLERTLTTWLAPLVTTLTDRSGLSRGALWRLVGDALSACLLAQGRVLGCPERAMRIALGPLRDPSSPLHAPQNGFVRVTLPEDPTVSDWAAKRGGCCRYYTAGAETCATCVLRDDDSREALLREDLRRRHGRAAA